MSKQELIPAFVLHTRQYRDSSLLVEFFTLEHGRICAVARGARRQKSPLKGLLQPFVPLIISWVGNKELVTLINAELNGVMNFLSGNQLVSALYINELLFKLLHKHDPHQVLFTQYQNAITSLANTEYIEIPLREFELVLLEQLGYGVQLDKLANKQEKIISDKFYAYQFNIGLIKTEENNGYFGKDLLAIQQRDFSDAQTRKTAKHLLRKIIQNLLGDKSIHCRKMFSTG